MLASGACAPTTGIYKPRRPQASLLFRLVSDQFAASPNAYDDRFAQTYDDGWPGIREVADKFLACRRARTRLRPRAVRRVHA
jgi:hypothetical protein